MRMFNILLIAERTNALGSVGNVRAFGDPYLCVCIPWEMIAPHEQQAKKNHQQSLERLHERGGLSACEALAVLEDRPWHAMPTGKSNHELCRAVAVWVDDQLMPEPGTALTME